MLVSASMPSDHDGTQESPPRPLRPRRPHNGTAQENSNEVIRGGADVDGRFLRRPSGYVRCSSEFRTLAQS